jgi:hypothetical protein
VRRIVRDPNFDLASILAIGANCLILALHDPTKPSSRYNQRLDGERGPRQ